MRPQTRIDWHARVDRILQGFLRHLDHPGELARLAAEAAASPWHFQRMFQGLTGESPDDCLRRLRLEKAPWLLRRRGAKVVDVALACGYASPEAFTRSFRKAWGLSPTAVKALPGWHGSLPSPAGIHYAPEARERWHFINDEGDEAMQTKVVLLEERRLFGLAAGAEPWQLPQAWSRFGAALEQAGLAASARAWLSTFPATAAAAGALPGLPPLAACIAVDSLPQGPACPAGLSEWRLPGGLFAVVVHFGSSEEIGTTVSRWEERWLPTSSWEADPSRPRYEWYQNGHLAPELQLTFWCAPVRKAETGADR